MGTIHMTTTRLATYTTPVQTTSKAPATTQANEPYLAPQNRPQQR